MNKIAIVTAAAGDRDFISDPGIKFPNVDYIAFTNQKFKSDVWDVRPLIQYSKDNFKDRLNAKLPKILPEYYLGDQYEYIFWVDATLSITECPEKIIKTILAENDIAVLRHPTRTCVYKEMEENILRKRDDVLTIERQAQFYKEQGYKKNQGLYACGVIFRRMTDQIKKLNLSWWFNICKYSSRDQLSFPYCLWETNVKCNKIDGNIYNQNGFVKYTNRPTNLQQKTY